jgi:hypothetical protein
MTTSKSSSADSVRAFQRAVSEDKVSAVIASYINDVVLALEPWAAQLLPCRRTTDGAMEEPAGADSDVRHQRAGTEPDILEGHQWRVPSLALATLP